MQLTNATITGVKEVKRGDGEHGPWILYHLTIDGKRFSLFQNATSPDPQPGQVIAFSEVEEKQDGKYTNRTLKKIKWAEKAITPEVVYPSTGKNGKEDTPYSMLLSYAKDVVIHHPGSQQLSLVDYANAILTVAAMFQGSLGMASKKVEKPPDDKYLAWVAKVKKDLTDKEWEELCYIYDCKTIETVTDPNVREDIYKAVKTLKSKRDDNPF